MKIIIAGSRSISLTIKEVQWHVVTSGFPPDLIISGMAKGPDLDGKKWADHYGFPVLEMPADWSLGRGAGIIRNHEMGDMADALIAIYDGSSPGTKDMIQYMRKLNKHLYICDKSTGIISIDRPNLQPQIPLF